jgi:hypothetical protein
MIEQNNCPPDRSPPTEMQCSGRRPDSEAAAGARAPEATSSAADLQPAWLGDAPCAPGQPESRLISRMGMIAR